MRYCTMKLFLLLVLAVICQVTCRTFAYIYQKRSLTNCPSITCVGYNCTVELGENNCPVCSCKKSCETPVCPTGCEPEEDNITDRCPGCVCKLARSGRDIPKVCPPPTCVGYNCVVYAGEDGCQSCVCDSPCIPPQCPSKCEVEKDVPKGRCPGCVCKPFPVTDGEEVKTTSSYREEDLCGKLHCPEGQTCILSNRGLCGNPVCPPTPICVDIEPVCPTPVCAKGCIVLKREGDNCPSCYCGVTKETNKTQVCPPVSCPGYHCSLSKASNGCQICTCETPCVPPQCPPECEIETNVPDGRCPGCVCKLGLQGNEESQCPPINCFHENCREVIGADGCPLCICDPMCPPTNCDPNCRVQSTTVPPGECPGCVCDDDPPVTPPAQCSKINCDNPGCTEVIGADGCMNCICKISCVPPKCESPCELRLDVAAGECAYCSCPKSTTTTTTTPSPVTQCAVVTCHPNCQYTYKDDGCPSCECRLNCTIPTCEVGCQLNRSIPSWECPQCECPNITNEAQVVETETIPSITTQIASSDNCQPIECRGRRCQTITGDDGCPRCVCQLRCPLLRCSGRCYPEPNPPPHRCPGCVCPRTQG